MNIYVTNLNPDTEDSDLFTLFSPHGTVTFCRVIIDPYTGKPKGHGFVEMPQEEAAAAIAALDNMILLGNRIRVMEARPAGLSNSTAAPRRS